MAEEKALFLSDLWFNNVQYNDWIIFGFRHFAATKYAVRGANFVWNDQKKGIAVAIPNFDGLVIQLNFDVLDAYLKFLASEIPINWRIEAIGTLGGDLKLLSIEKCASSATPLKILDYLELELAYGNFLR